MSDRFLRPHLLTGITLLEELRVGVSHRLYDVVRITCSPKETVPE